MSSAIPLAPQPTKVSSVSQLKAKLRRPTRKPPVSQAPYRNTSKTRHYKMRQSSHQMSDDSRSSPDTGVPQPGVHQSTPSSDGYNNPLLRLREQRYPSNGNASIATTLYITGLDQHITDAELRLILTSVGLSESLEDIQVGLDIRFKGSNYGFVSYVDPRAARNAMRFLNGKVIHCQRQIRTFPAHRLEENLFYVPPNLDQADQPTVCEIWNTMRGAKGTRGRGMGQMRVPILELESTYLELEQGISQFFSVGDKTTEHMFGSLLGRSLILLLLYWVHVFQPQRSNELAAALSTPSKTPCSENSDTYDEATDRDVKDLPSIEAYKNSLKQTKPSRNHPSPESEMPTYDKASSGTSRELPHRSKNNPSRERSIEDNQQRAQPVDMDIESAMGPSLRQRRDQPWSPFSLREDPSMESSIPGLASDIHTPKKGQGGTSPTQKSQSEDIESQTPDDRFLNFVYTLRAVRRFVDKIQERRAERQSHDEGESTMGAEDESLPPGTMPPLDRSGTDDKDEMDSNCCTSTTDPSMATEQEHLVEEILSPIKREVVDRVMAMYDKALETGYGPHIELAHFIAAGETSRAGGNSTQTRSSDNSPIATRFNTNQRASAGSSLNQKRKAKDSGNSRDDDEDGNKRPRRPGIKPIQEETLRKWACPYFQRQPNKPVKSAACFQSGFPDISKLK
ncbi:uncharacterized protein K452DRAFT_116285 [Aplosporella prunicola CBS 121167]|uniref:RRM domain-containing protein n=1 Tax=Aplosporella prunicola CBS 121167 TaxID=1176127 RepID=A0A6A6AZA5_9PEZI|nr:uncharacterized protein K452DRAFT_116285 [Aplosporella prunicola CBS 121167]KAF2136976.1 hypothetical protein K452DRAFT_116285 [Aplosporella prunicola CBS 121167]